MKPVLLLSLALSLSGCASISTDSDYSTQVDFNQYRSWAWISPDDSNGVSPYQQDGLNEQRIRAAVTAQLQQQGLAQVSAEGADLLVNTLTSVETKIDVDTFYGNFGYHPYYQHYPLSAGFGTETRVREYQQGTLMIDLIDADSRQLVWRGSATSNVKKRQTPQQKSDRIQQTVTAILAQFPPQSGN
ncbi:DUF4136 domain-containing protein [uncultured Ferrimonas sp.]|uniref:DUF4136 domain-containing protein n=1 Tax=uncultured Ferrimonas sp. TaxID=432640 RepID=UPI002611F3D4|nr:DUF4136 domain-containing protein [uncultured Ferrimonas sp.]